MLQINASTIPSIRPPEAAGDAADRPLAPGDGFEALLAGLMGIAVPAMTPLEPTRPLWLAAAEAETAPEDGEAGLEAPIGDDETAPEADRRATGERPAGHPGSEAPKTELREPPAKTPDAVPASRLGPTSLSPPAPAAPEPKAGEPARDVRPSGDAAAFQKPTVEPAANPASPFTSSPADRAPADRAPIATPPTATHSNMAETAARPAGRAEQRPAGERSPGPVQPQRDGLPRLTTAGGSAPADASTIAVRSPMPGPLFSTAGGRLGPIMLQADWQDLSEVTGLRSPALTPTGSAPATAVLAESTAAEAAPMVRQLAAAIERAVGGELQRLTIQLAPKALGAIEIALEFDIERRLAVVIQVERPETLELLRGESRELQRLLAQQGIDLADAGLEFGLMSGERRDHRGADHEDMPGDPAHEPDADDAGPAASPADGPAPRDLAASIGRLNLTI